MKLIGSLSLITFFILSISTKVLGPVLLCHSEKLPTDIRKNVSSLPADLESPEEAQAAIYRKCDVKSNVFFDRPVNVKVDLQFELPSNGNFEELEFMLPAQEDSIIYKMELEFLETKIKYISMCQPTFQADEIYEKTTENETCGTMKKVDNILIAKFKLQKNINQLTNQVLITIFFDSKIYSIQNSMFGYNFAFKSFFKYGSEIDHEKSDLKSKNDDFLLTAKFSFENANILFNTAEAVVEFDKYYSYVKFNNPNDDILSVKFAPNNIDSNVNVSKFICDGLNVVEVVIPPAFDSLKESLTKPYELIVLLDVSGSMVWPYSSPAWKLLENAVCQLILNLENKNIFVNFLLFDHENQLLLSENPQSFKIKSCKTDFESNEVIGFDLIKIIKERKAFKPNRGATDIYKAIKYARDNMKRVKVEGVEIPRKIFVITDGGDNNKEIEKLIKEQKDTRFFALGLGQAASLDTISRIANAGLGFWQHVSEVKNLKDTLLTMVDQFSIDPRDFEFISEKKEFKGVQMTDDGEIMLQEGFIYQVSPTLKTKIPSNCYSVFYLISKNKIEDVSFVLNEEKFEFKDSQIKKIDENKAESSKRMFNQFFYDKIEEDMYNHLENQHPGGFELEKVDDTKEDIRIDKDFLKMYKQLIAFAVKNDILCCHTTLILGSDLPDKNLWKNDSDLDSKLITNFFKSITNKKDVPKRNQPLQYLSTYRTDKLSRNRDETDGDFFYPLCAGVSSAVADCSTRNNSSDKKPSNTFCQNVVFKEFVDLLIIINDSTTLMKVLNNLAFIYKLDKTSDRYMKIKKYIEEMSSRTDKKDKIIESLIQFMSENDLFDGNLKGKNILTKLLSEKNIE